jgi:6-pyruvoyl-tetrahydropterin synthase
MLTQRKLFTSLILKASHQLEAREELHFHFWEIEWTFKDSIPATPTSQSSNDMILPLHELRAQLEKIFAPLQNTHLNNNPLLRPETQLAPTCENLVIDVRNMTQHLGNLIEIKVSLKELDGSLWGGVILSHPSS